MQHGDWQYYQLVLSYKKMIKNCRSGNAEMSHAQ